MALFIVKLHFEKPFRVGSVIKGVGLENSQNYINSDTIFSALVNVWNKYNIIDSIELQNLECYKDFIISSAYPYSFFKEKDYFFLPTPKMPYPLTKRHYAKYELNKILKQSTFLPSEYVKNFLIDGEGLSKERFETIKEKINTQYRATTQKLTPHHLQDRITSDSQLYYKAILYANRKRGGLYFLINICKDEDQWKDRFNKGLKALSKEGLGGERTYLGKFFVDDNSGTLLNVNPYHDLSFLGLDTGSTSNYYYVISLLFPNDNDLGSLDTSKSYYDLIIKKGWTFSTLSYIQMKRKTVPFFSEGSVFNFKPEGKIVDARPVKNGVKYPHPVWRYGKAFAIRL